MNREKVVSSNIESIGYDPATQILEVEFKPNGKVWHYLDVPPAKFAEMKSATSIGAWFAREIKPRYKGVPA